MDSEGTTEWADERRSLAASAKRTLLVRLGSRLKRARLKVQKTQAEVAILVEATAQTVRNWEAGRFEPPPQAINTLAQIYRVSEEELLEGLDSAIEPPHPITRFRYNGVLVDPQKLTAARTQAGYTQATIAEMTGLSQSAITR